MQRATTRRRNTTGGHYNPSVHQVKPAVIIGQFRCHDFLGSVEGSLWRPVWAITPPAVSPDPCQQCFQLRHLLGSKPNKGTLRLLLLSGRFQTSAPASGSSEIGHEQTSC
jgi:hypothetical protein